MRYGDEIMVLERGPRINAKALQPIAIGHGSTCWGVYVPDLDHPEKMPHLLISPLHPDSWPVSFRLALKLDHKPEALANAARVVASADVNVLFAECTPSGHSHATWNAMCEALTRKSYLAEHKPRTDLDAAKAALEDQDGELTKFIRAWGAYLFDFIDKLKAHIEYANKKDRFLHPAILGGRRKFWHYDNTDSLTQGAWERIDPTRAPKILEDTKRQQTPAWDAFVNPNLAFFWLFGTNSSRPMAFKYDAESALLRPLPGSEDAFRQPPRMRPLNFPILTTVSLDTREQFIRIAYPEPGAAGRRLFVEATYRAAFSPDRPLHERTLKGFLANICSRLAKPPLELNLMQVSNKTLEWNKESEHGTIYLVGERRPDHNQEVTDEFLQQVKSAVREETCDYKWMKPDGVDAGRGGLRRVFLSTRFDWRGYSAFIEKAGGEAKRQGFELVFVENPVGVPIAEKVVEKAQGCQGFVHLVPLIKPDERPTKVSLEWILFEYGLARGLRRPSVVMVDCRAAKKNAAKRKRLLSQWQIALRVHAGQTLVPFDSSAGVEQVVAEFGSALRLLWGELARSG